MDKDIKETKKMISQHIENINNEREITKMNQTKILDLKSI